MSENPGQSGHALPGLERPVCAKAQNPTSAHRLLRVRARGHAAATPLSSVMNSPPSSRIRISCYRLAAGRSPTGTMMCAYGVPFHMT